MKSTIPRGLATLGMFTLSFSIIYLVFLTTVNSDSVYEGIEDQEQNAKVLSYLKGEPLELDFLDEKERSHMRDVQGMFTLAWGVFLFCFGSWLFVCGIFTALKRWQPLEEFAARSFQLAGTTILFFSVFIGIAAFIDFDMFWTIFHIILFPQGNWLFPTSSGLINMYPNSFFKQFLITFGIRLGIVSLVSAIIGTWMLHMLTHEKAFQKK